MKTFRFRLAGAEAAFEHSAGQYVTLGLEIDGATIYRCYTVSSAPATQAEGEFDVTVKCAANGVVSPWLHKNLRIGSKLLVSRPAGGFVLPENDGEPMLFIAGGLGITPLMSMAREVVARAGTTNIQFLQFVRTPDDILFRDELSAMGNAGRGIAPHFFVARSGAEGCIVGRLSRDVLDEAVPDWRSRRVLCCGPETFMFAMREAFLASGGEASRFHQESFELHDAPTNSARPEAATSTIRLALSGVSVSCTAGTTILDAVHTSAAGIKIPNACRSGVCGSCKLRKLDGEVDMQHNGGVTEEEINEGYILACCAVPLSNLTVEY